MATIVHPSAIIGPPGTIEAGTTVHPGVVLACDVSLGRTSIVNHGGKVGQDGVLADSSFIAPGAHLPGGIQVGREANGSARRSSKASRSAIGQS